MKKAAAYLKDLGVPPVGVLPPQLPRLEERIPVDVRDECLDRILDRLAAEELHDAQHNRPCTIGVQLQSRETRSHAPPVPTGHRVPPVGVGAHGSTAKRHSARTCGLTGGAAPFQSTFRCIDLTLSIGSDLRS
jgi:hypothetical protein